MLKRNIFSFNVCDNLSFAQKGVLCDLISSKNISLSWFTNSGNEDSYCINFVLYFFILKTIYIFCIRSHRYATRVYNYKYNYYVCIYMNKQIKKNKKIGNYLMHMLISKQSLFYQVSVSIHTIWISEFCTVSLTQNALTQSYENTNLLSLISFKQKHW